MLEENVADREVVSVNVAVRLGVIVDDNVDVRLGVSVVEVVTVGDGDCPSVLVRSVKISSRIGSE